MPSSDRRNRSKPSSERRPDPSVAHCCITPIAAATPWLLLEHGRGSATIVPADPLAGAAGGFSIWPKSGQSRRSRTAALEDRLLPD